MANEIVVPGLQEMGAAKYADDKSFAVVAQGANYLPRVQLMGANSNAVKEGKIGQGRYAFVRGKDQMEDLTQEIPVLVLGWRPKALQILEDEVISVFNPASEEFKRIAATADSGAQDTGCMYGPEFLVWVPAVKAFGTFYMSSKTARREAPQMRALMGKLALLKCQLIKAGKFIWHGPVVTMCSQAVSDMPGIEDVTEQVTKFNNPPESEKEAAPAESDRAR